MSNAKDLYFVAVKVLMRKSSSLLITHDVFGDWDIPGGRIKPDEFDAPLEDIIARKVREELGSDVVYQLGEPKVFFRHERTEHGTGKKARIFAVGFEAQYKSGKITLGEHHDKYEWVDLADFKPENYFTGGWLEGLREYIKSTAD